MAEKEYHTGVANAERASKTPQFDTTGDHTVTVVNLFKEQNLENSQPDPVTVFETTTNKESLMRPMTVGELKNELKIGVHPDETEKYYVPFTEKLLAMAVADEKTETEARQIYEKLLPHWYNLGRADRGVTDKNKKTTREVRMIAHSERVAGLMFDFSILYLKHKELVENPNAKDTIPEQWKVNLDEVQLTAEDVQFVVKNTLAGLIHDIGKGAVTTDRRYKDGHVYRSILLNKGKRTPAQIARMRGENGHIGHAQHGGIIARDVGLPEFFINPIEEHHHTLDKTLDEIAFVTRMLTIADDVEAKTANRNYKNGDPIPLVLFDDILKDKLTHFYDEYLVFALRSWVGIQFINVRGGPHIEFDILDNGLLVIYYPKKGQKGVFYPGKPMKISDEDKEYIISHSRHAKH